MKNQFFIVGAQRSGTTYLYNILDEHPEICMAKPVRPEPKYFLQNDINIQEYREKFYSHCNTNIKIFGEKSTSYYENIEVAKRIYKYFPNAKIIFILANPIDRAISNYKFSYENGLERRSIKEVFIEEKLIDVDYHTSVNPFAYKERSLYYKYLEYYYDIFPANHIKVIIREKFVGNLKEIKDLYNFLNVDNEFVPTCYNKKINKSNITLDQNILKEVRIKLKSYFNESIEILEKKYNMDVSLWKNLY